jgi:hypothetical protein
MKPHGLALMTAALSLHHLTPARCMTQARICWLQNNPMEAQRMLMMAATEGEQWKRPNQRQRRKHNRQRHAAGDRRAFVA